MSKRIIFLGFVWFMVCSIFATDEVLMRIGDKKILQSEFEYFYKKNTIDTALNSSLEDYLQLFQNFKLKVCEAETLGIDTTSSFLEEFRGYRSQNASLYLTDKNKEELLMKEIYSHLLEDVDASHILIKVPFNASPEDTLLLYQKALNICKRLEKENFEEVAKEVSDDYSTKQKGGRLGFFTGMMTIFPFENAAYKTKIGEVSEPIRSSIGYHIIKVHDRRKAIGEIKDRTQLRVEAIYKIQDYLRKVCEATKGFSWYAETSITIYWLVKQHEIGDRGRNGVSFRFDGNGYVRIYQGGFASSLEIKDFLNKKESDFYYTYDNGQIKWNEGYLELIDRWAEIKQQIESCAEKAMLERMNKTQQELADFKASYEKVANFEA